MSPNYSNNNEHGEIIDPTYSLNLKDILQTIQNEPTSAIISRREAKDEAKDAVNSPTPL